MAAVPAHALASGWTGKVDESKLPACCRRHGLHHCNMHPGNSAHEVSRQPVHDSAQEPAQTTLSSTGTCPAIPQAAASTTAPFAALAAPRLAEHAFSEESVLPAARLATLLASDRRTQPKRGPPSETL